MTPPPSPEPDATTFGAELYTSELVDGHYWVAMACRVVQAVSVALIAVALIARL